VAVTRARAAVAVLVASALVAAGVLATVLTRPWVGAPPPLEQQVRDLTALLDPRGPYRAPEPAERDAVLGAVAALVGAGEVSGAARQALESAGFTVGVAGAATGGEFLVIRADPTTERSWGLLALPLGRTPQLLVEVPHPRADRETEEVGLALLGERPDAALLVAGAHRRAGDERADVAHADDSLFHALAVDLSTRLHLPQLQLHGFGDRAELDADVVLGGGPDDPAPAVRELADQLRAADVEVCRAWAERCSRLEGRTNVQGRAVAAAGLPFAHVELSAQMRQRPQETARALAGFGR
jgi:hypothetical protein